MNVVSVHTVNVSGKKRVGRYIGRTSSYKGYCKIGEGQDIDLFNY